MQMTNPGNILIVDDNPHNLQVLGGILQTDGFKVRPALSGELALRAIEAHLPDLILLDVRMPAMDGYEVCRRLKAMERSRDIPIIFISALNEINDKLNAFSAGAVDYITKPFQSEEVLARVRTQIDLAIARKALADKNAQLLALMEQLVQAEKLKSIELLAAGVAHELNTPIGNALLMLDAMDISVQEFAQNNATLYGEPSVAALIQAVREDVAFILRNLNRASSLIRSLKEVSVDRASERRRLINLKDTVSAVVAIMGARLSKHPYDVVIDVESDLKLDTYPGHLEQILDNLIQNSIIHAFDGAASGTITITARGTPSGGATLVVADNGKGIAAQHLKRVFDPFFTTRLGQGGSGLGLNIAYNLATGILGGNIKVSSEPNQGTQFTLSLPLSAPNMPLATTTVK